MFQRRALQYRRWMPRVVTSRLIYSRLGMIRAFIGDTMYPWLLTSHVSIIRDSCCRERKNGMWSPKYWTTLVHWERVDCNHRHRREFIQYILSTFQREMYKWCIQNWQRIIIFHLSKLWKAKFSILCDVIFFETAGEIWNCSLLGVKGLRVKEVSSYLHWVRAVGEPQLCPVLLPVDLACWPRKASHLLWSACPLPSSSFQLLHPTFESCPWALFHYQTGPASSAVHYVPNWTLWPSPSATVRSPLEASGYSPWASPWRLSVPGWSCLSRISPSGDLAPLQQAWLPGPPVRPGGSQLSVAAVQPL